MLKVITDSWDHPWEGFKSSFVGCNQSEVEWVAPCYENEQTEIEWPLAGSILWHLNHVGACKSAYAWDLNHPDEKDNLSTWSVELNLDKLRLRLDEVHDEFCKASKIFDPRRVIMGKGGHALEEYIGIVIRHEIWHGGQIALIRRMYKILSLTSR